MWGDADLVAEFGDAYRAEQVDLDGRVEWRIERDRGGRVNDGVAAGERRSIGIVQVEAVTADVTGDRGDATVGHLGEGLARLRRTELLAEPVERVVLQDLLLSSLGGGSAFAVADEQDKFAVGDGAQHALNECRANKTGRAGDGNTFARKGFGDHA